MVPCTAPISRITHILLHEYHSPKDAVTHIYRGLMGTFQLERYGDLCVEILEGCQSLNATEYMCVTPMELYADGSYGTNRPENRPGSGSYGTNRPGSGSFQPVNPTVGVSGGTLREHGATGFYLNKEDEGEGSDCEVEVVGRNNRNDRNGGSGGSGRGMAQQGSNGTNTTNTNANANNSGDALCSLLNKLRENVRRSHRNCLSREELYIVYTYIYLLGVVHAHWGRRCDSTTTAICRKTHQFSAYICLYSLYITDETQNEEVLRQYVCLLGEMGFNNAAIEVAQNYCSSNSSNSNSSSSTATSNGVRVGSGFGNTGGTTTTSNTNSNGNSNTTSVPLQHFLRMMGRVVNTTT